MQTAYEGVIGECWWK